MNGTASMPHDGGSPKAIATSRGKHPYTPVLAAIQSASATTSSGTSTGVASIASYDFWKTRRTKVVNIPANTDEKITAVATEPVPMNSMYG